ncbi:MAG: hypothetical protein WBM29_01830 [Candidatus Deferrimicrobium sp.]
MKRTKASKPRQTHSTIGLTLGETKRRRAAISWEAGTTGTVITVEFFSDDPDTFHLLADLFTPLLLRRVPGDGADMILASHGFKFNPGIFREIRSNMLLVNTFLSDTLVLHAKQ